MSKRIILSVILLVLILIVGAFYVLQTKTPAVVDWGTDFPIVTTPVETPAKLFSELLLTTPDPVEQTVLNTINQDEYYIYPCAAVNTTASDVLVLVAKYSQNPSGTNTFAPAETAVKIFENDIYTKWGHLVYKDSFQPNLTAVKFTNEKVADPEVSTDTYRIVTLSDNQTKLYYGWVLNYLFVAASKDCLLETMKSVYSLH